NVRREAGDDAALRLELAAAYKRIGGILGGSGQSSMGDSRGALSSLRHAEELLTPLYQRGDVRAAALLGWTLRDIGELRRELNEGAGALHDLERGCEIARKLVAERPNDPEAYLLASGIAASITRLAQSIRDPERARSAAEEAVRMAQARVALAPGD